MRLLRLRAVGLVLLPSILVLVVSLTSGLALVARQEPSRFDSVAVEPPGLVFATRGQALAELPSNDALRAGWENFSARHSGWSIWLDERSGMPALAQGAGVPWLAEEDMTGPDAVERLAEKARLFLAENAPLLGKWDSQLQLDYAASGPIGRRAFVLTFRQVVAGVPVDGARFDFHLVNGRLVAFGAERLARVKSAPAPRFSDSEARDALYAHLQLADAAELAEDAVPELLFAPVDPRGVRAGLWGGVRGEGLTHMLVWRFRLHAVGEEARWVADVDAQRNVVVALRDETKYDRVKGGVYPLSSDGIGAEGNERGALPMPFADISLNGVASSPANAHGLYTCSTPGAAVRTTLAGPYVRINDACGAVSESSVCGDSLDLQTGPAGSTNCVTPTGASAGNTHASRSCFYSVNRIKEKGRAWLPSNSWLQNQVVVNSNVNSTCNASWGGELNMYRAGSGCRNTCELQGVVVHELGHGLDQNDGGGYDNPSEAYADVVAILEARESCVGRGFVDSNCGGYGDACINCTGIRDQDWNKRAAQTPATPQGFATSYCPSGGGPCGKEEHCEAYVSAEAVYDLAARDLVAGGLDADSAWQLADRLFYESRQGSGGAAYNCALPSSDGCGTNSWFHKFRLADDDDGNLNNGTPHAAAIYAAFARHNIACGASTDASNQNSSACPALSQPSLSAAIASNGIQLTWSAVPNAANYRIYRNDLGCNRSQVPIATVPSSTTSYTDTQVSEAVEVHYRVQAVGANDACESRVSDCETISFVGLAGRVEFGKSSYGCSAPILVRVLDGDAAPGQLEVRVWSDREQTPEILALVETSPGSHVFEGSIASTTGAPTAGDSTVAVGAGSQVTAEYLDPSNGAGGGAYSVRAITIDCAASGPTSVRVTDITDGSAIVRWTTAEPTTGRVEWGPTSALGAVAQDATLSTEHAVTLSPLAECGRQYFRVVAIDRVGNETTIDAGGQPFGFNAGLIPGFFRDDFETATGWTLEGEWQRDIPQGKGTNDPDPTAAFGGTRVLGHDLTGLGTRPGDYERSTTQRAISPVLNASGKTGVEIKFRRWLNIGWYATGIVEMRVNNGTWQTVWTSPATFGMRESAWSQQTIALPNAENQSNFQISFRMNGGTSTSGASSWNVDRLVVRQSSQPLGDACGGCGGAPTFSGAAAAVDADPCSTAGGVTVSWEAAAAWGTGRGGTYSVYRDTAPNFTPGSGNRIAVGLTSTSFTDSNVVNGQTYYYLVRAENDETCSSGPNNGGVTESNTVYRAVTTASSQGTPAEVAGLLIQPPVRPDVRLTWSPAGGASKHRVYRSSTPVGGFTQRLELSANAANDAGAANDGLTWFYLVKGVNACGQQGP